MTRNGVSLRCHETMTTTASPDTSIPPCDFHFIRQTGKDTHVYTEPKKPKRVENGRQGVAARGRQGSAGAGEGRGMALEGTFPVRRW